MTDADAPADPATDAWPDPSPEQVRVMLLGTYHMDDPGLDEVNVDADDVLAPDRQAELRDLVDRLAEWGPDWVAVERPYDSAEAVNALYEEYRSGERSYDREEASEPSRDRHGEANVPHRSEVVQVGFRLADRLDHDRVVLIDEYPAGPDADPFEDRDVDASRKTAVEVPDPEGMKRENDQRLASSTLSAYLAWVNREDRLRENHDLMFDRGIRAADEQFGSPVALAHWYDRNVRMVHHLWRGMASDDDRVLLLVGSGHVRALRHLLIEAPMFCPVSPLPYLE